MHVVGLEMMEPLLDLTFRSFLGDLHPRSHVVGSGLSLWVVVNDNTFLPPKLLRRQLGFCTSS